MTESRPTDALWETPMITVHALTSVIGLKGQWWLDVYFQDQTLTAIYHSGKKLCTLDMIYLNAAKLFVNKKAVRKQQQT